MESQIMLILPNEKYEEQIREYKSEHVEAGDHGLSNECDIKKWIKDANNNHNNQDIPDNRVASSVYFAVTKENNKRLV